MAELGDPILLGNWPSGIVGLSPAHAGHYPSTASHKAMENGIVITAQGNGVYIYHLHERKCIHSWSVKPSFRFTHHAILVEASKEEGKEATEPILYAVADDRVLLQWPLTTLTGDFERSVTRLPLDEPISAIHTHPQLPGAIVIVMASGSVALVNKDASRAFGWCSPKNGRLKESPLWSHLAPLSARELILLVADRTGLLHRFMLQSDSLSITARDAIFLGKGTAQEQPMKISLSPDGATLAVLDNANRLLFYPARSLFNLEEPDPIETPDQTISLLLPTTKSTEAVTATARTPGKGSKAEQNASTPTATNGPDVTMAYLESSFLALATRSSQGNVLTVWDTRFGTSQAEIPLKLDGVANEDDSLIQGILNGVGVKQQQQPGSFSSCALPGYLSCASPKGDVWLIAAAAPAAASLLSALGRMRASLALPTTKKTTTTLSQPVNPPLNEEERQLIDALAAAATLEDFNQAYFGYMKKQSSSRKQQQQNNSEQQQQQKEEEAVPAAGSADKKGKKGSKTTKEKQVQQQQQNGENEQQAPTHRYEIGKRKGARVLSQHAIHAIVELCLREKSPFFPVAVLQHLLKSDCISATLEERLVPTIISKHSLELLDMVLNHVHDLPEVQLLAILQFALSGAEEELLAKWIESKRTNDKQDVLLRDDQPRDGLLYLIVSAPRNNIFMESCIRSLTFPQVLSLLRFLSSLLARHCKYLESTLRRRTCLRLPTFAQVLDWLALVIDGHFASLVLSPSAQPLLSTLAETVSQQLALCDAIEDLRGHLQALTSSELAQGGSHSGMAAKDYAIEVFVL